METKKQVSYRLDLETLKRLEELRTYYNAQNGVKLSKTGLIRVLVAESHKRLLKCI